MARNAPRHQPCLLSRHSSANRNHGKSPLRQPHLERIRPNKQHAQIAKTSSRILQRGLGAGTPNPIQCASIAIGFGAAGNAHSIRPQPPRPPVRLSNQTRYPKLPHLILAMPAGDVAANMLRSGRASLVTVHQ